MMLKAARNNPQPSYLPVKRFSKEAHLESLYVGLNIELARLVSILRDQQKHAILSSYCCTLRYFLEIASSNNCPHQMFLTEEELQRFASQWKSDSGNKVYLIIQQQLNQSYFNRNNNAFIHAWHLFIKFGINELNLDQGKIERRYFEQFPI